MKLNASVLQLSLQWTSCIKSYLEEWTFAVVQQAGTSISDKSATSIIRVQVISPLSSLFSNILVPHYTISDTRTQHSWFIRAFTKNSLCSLQWIVCVQSTLISLTSTLILSSHLKCGLPISLLLGSRLPNMYTFPIYLTISTYHKTLCAEYKLQS
jgi:hypothetical protein